MYKCVKCGDRFSGEQLSELRHEGEQFSMHPFMCPDCYDRHQRQDLEDQFSDLIGDEDE
jgi:DNA-directed RNA polymerase subunit RPC12/RpoP